MNTNKTTFLRTAAAVLLLVAFGISAPPAALAGESTMPPQYTEVISPELASRYTYTEDGPLSDALKLPVYQWMPTAGPPKAIFLGIHGLTLHGRRFRVLARSLAVNGAGFISMDMRGFGRCHFDKEKKFSPPGDDKTRVNYEKSYEDIVALAKLIKEKYPRVRIVALGESLGCTFCVRLAAEHPELVSAIVLSAPAVHLNKDMYAGKGQIRQGIKSIVRLHRGIDMRSFFAELCSNRMDVQNEMMDDPMVRKELRLKTLIATDAFVDKTVKWGKKTPANLSVLILQGSADGCVSPKHVTDLMNSMVSDDQILAWRGKFGHLQLETIFMRAATVDAIGSWLLSHSKDQKVKLKALQQDIAHLGGTITE